MHFDTTSVFIVPIVCLFIFTPYTTSWWAASSQLVVDPKVMCKKPKMTQSSGRMMNICKRKPELLEQITKGIDLGQHECQYQFRNRRWNCTSARRSIKRVILRDTRETGFVNAVIAAGITFQVTRACTKGELIGCSCAKRKKGRKVKKKTINSNSNQMTESDFKWAGCGENIDFGMKKSKDFLDIIYKKRSDMKTLVKLHNYVAGRLAIRNNMRTDCKCHGISGSCTLKTCSRKMPTFREIGNKIKERFDGAVKVIPGNDGHSFIPEGETIKPPSKFDLVYSEDSPTYCNPNMTLGSFGTKGRECKDNSPSEEGCGIMCCGRGALPHTEEIKMNCNCTFKYCCEVQCQICRLNKTTHICL